MPGRTCALLALLLVGLTQRAGAEPTVNLWKNETVRFVALGDTGKGNDTQYAVARAMAKVCADRGGCAFGLLLGDIIYQHGVTSPDDPQWKTKFELPYAADPFPFYGALGNHDYGTSWEYWKPPQMLAYAAKSKQLRMPGPHYTFSQGPVDFIAVDTNPLFWGMKKEEASAFSTSRQASQRPWRIAFGHHPYLSNGKHGNAGHYEGIPFGWLPAAGGTLKDFFEQEVCGKIDVYLAGHDHNLQDLGERCGTEWLVSGGGSSVTGPLSTTRNHAEFQASVPGFLLVEATAEELKLTFFDESGKELHSRTVTHKRAR